ncbi:MAG: hypothetical protein EOP83_29150 [Verrucomicrobiaceae bacterium]|nr:MAG: hypothetical protein EOP83_29150 [Verrucomicrobiaceae bacterium]
MRLLSFWLGLPVFVFLLWAWWDSMHRAAATNWSYGKTLSLLWPPYQPPPKGLPIQEIDPTPPQFSPFDTPAEDPGIGGMGFRPTYLPRTRFGSEARVSSQTTMQPYRSIGSKAGSLWISDWIAPKSPPKPRWHYAAEAQDGTWFPPLERSHTAITRNTTTWIPYWLLSGTYTLAWALLLIWRTRRRRRLSCLMAAKLD